MRPGFDWFFGRDSFWTSFALNAAGDFSSARTALEFVSKYQREDGKIPHEISQGAHFVDWFKGYPYPYASADATPLYIIAMNDYVVESGDAAFAKQKWNSLWKAYEFLRSTFDEQGFPKNAGIGHAWVEAGPLLPPKTHLYQTRFRLQALRAPSAFPGWAAVREYRYYRPVPATTNLRANALLALDGSLGHVTEVLSGSYYQSLSTSSPHQIWSAAMVVGPLLRGMLGLQVDAAKATLTLAPHVPADWTSFRIGLGRVGSASLDLHYPKDPGGVSLVLEGDCD